MFMAARSHVQLGELVAGTALLVVDMVHDFVDGVLGSEGARRAVPRVAQVLAEARQRQVPVFFVQDAHEVGDPELELWGPHAIAGTRGAKTVPELAPREGERVLSKHWYNAFTNPALGEELDRLGVDHVVLVGVSTDICVQNTCAGAFFRALRSTVVSDATASIASDAHAGALEYMRNIFGARIVVADTAFDAEPVGPAGTAAGRAAGTVR
jgi:nicotinamidase-related amidase